MANSPLHIVEVIRALRDTHLAPSIQVFGLAARGSSLANDVDIVLNLRGLTPPVAGMGARYAAMRLRSEIERQYGFVLSLAVKHFRCLDPFLVTDHGLFTRNERATGWTRAENSAALLETVLTTSVSLASVMALYSVKPK